ncbi:MAG TPA: hypothetical protein VN625_09480 [Desulfuromonadaceae bacterium]|nr:hypothetical protein [Desulfuromonadaceae bacterium]
MKNKILIATLVAGGLLTLGPALFAADTNSPPANAPAAGAPGAPGGPGGRNRMGPNIEQVGKDLGLTEDQTAKFKSIMETSMQKRRELFQDNSTSREDRMTKMKAIQEDTDAKLKSLLTPEQYDKWQKMPRPGMRRQHSGDQGGAAGGAGGENKPANPQE